MRVLPCSNQCALTRLRRIRSLVSHLPFTHPFVESRVFETQPSLLARSFCFQNSADPWPVCSPMPQRAAVRRPRVIHRAVGSTAMSSPRAQHRRALLLSRRQRAKLSPFSCLQFVPVPLHEPRGSRCQLRSSGYLETGAGSCTTSSWACCSTSSEPFTAAGVTRSLVKDL